MLCLTRDFPSRLGSSLWLRASGLFVNQKSFDDLVTGQKGHSAPQTQHPAGDGVRLSVRVRMPHGE